MRRIADLKSRLQRTNPVEHATDYNRMFGELVALEQHRRNLRELADRRRVRRRTKPAGRTSAAGEKVLAWADAESTARSLAGTRDALYRRPTSRTSPWEEVEAADWDRDTSALRVSEVGSWGEQRVEHDLHDRRARPAARAGPRAGHRQRRPAAARARSTGRRGLRVIARRAPRGDRPLAWFYEYDEGVDPDDPGGPGVAPPRRRWPTARDEVGPREPDSRRRFRVTGLIARPPC